MLIRNECNTRHIVRDTFHRWYFVAIYPIYVSECSILDGVAVPVSESLGHSSKFGLGSGDCYDCYSGCRVASFSCCFLVCWAQQNEACVQ